MFFAWLVVLGLKLSSKDRGFQFLRRRAQERSMEMTGAQRLCMRVSAVKACISVPSCQDLDGLITWFGMLGIHLGKALECC